MKKGMFFILAMMIFVLSGCKKEEAVWEITQYGPRDINSSFYTIYNEEQGLIVIDGGWIEDAAYVREIINSFGVPVEAWILTHPHQDHVGAFNVLYTELDEIDANNVYTVEMASSEECMAVAPWDSVEAYNAFLELDVSNLHYVYPEDVLDVFSSLDFELLPEVSFITFSKTVSSLFSYEAYLFFFFGRNPRSRKRSPMAGSINLKITSRNAAGGKTKNKNIKSPSEASLSLLLLLLLTLVSYVSISNILYTYYFEFSIPRRGYFVNK